MTEPTWCTHCEAEAIFVAVDEEGKEEPLCWQCAYHVFQSGQRSPDFRVYRINMRDAKDKE